MTVSAESLVDWKAVVHTRSLLPGSSFIGNRRLAGTGSPLFTTAAEKGGNIHP
jgi:hypothetical protein